MTNAKCLALSLFVFFKSWADYANDTFSLDNPAIFTDFLNGSSYFHAIYLVN